MLVSSASRKCWLSHREPEKQDQDPDYAADNAKKGRFIAIAGKNVPWSYIYSHDLADDIQRIQQRQGFDLFVEPLANRDALALGKLLIPFELGRLLPTLSCVSGSCRIVLFVDKLGVWKTRGFQLGLELLQASGDD